MIAGKTPDSDNACMEQLNAFTTLGAWAQQTLEHYNLYAPDSRAYYNQNPLTTV
jgi:hypothetical protein